MYLKWLAGKEIGDLGKNPVSKSSHFQSYIVHLHQPRCVIAVGSAGFLDGITNLHLVSTGAFMKNRTQGLEYLIMEWLDGDFMSDEEIISFIKEASTEYMLNVFDEAAVLQEAM